MSLAASRAARTATANSLLYFGVLVILQGCAPRPAPPEPAEEAAATQVLERFDSIDDSTLTRVFGEVNNREHTRSLHVAQRIGTRSAATIDRIVHQVPGQEANVLSQSETGTFAHGFRGPTANTLNSVALVNDILEEDPAHLSARFAEDYIYRMLPDTTLWDRVAQVIAIDAREGSRQPVRKARYSIDQGIVVGTYLERVHEALFFSERSYYYIQARPLPQGGWVPSHIHLSVTLNLPLRSKRTLERSETFYLYR